MTSADSLHFASIGNIQSQSLMFSYSPDKKTRAYQEEYKKKAKTLISEYQTTGNKKKRFKQDSVFGTWFVTIVDQYYCFMCEIKISFDTYLNVYIPLIYSIGLTHTNFQDRLAYKMLGELKEQTDQIVTSLSNPEIETFFPDLRKIFQQAFELYREGAPANDKLAMAQQKVKQVQHVMQQNVKSMIDGQANLQELEGNTHELLNSASEFKKGSGDLTSLMRRRKCKLYFIFGVIVIALLLYILIPIFQ